MLQTCLMVKVSRQEGLKNRVGAWLNKSRLRLLSLLVLSEVRAVVMFSARVNGVGVGVGVGATVKVRSCNHRLSKFETDFKMYHWLHLFLLSSPSVCVELHFSRNYK